MRLKEMKSINLISIFSGMIFALLTYGIVKYFGIDETLKLSVFAGALFTVILYLALLLYKRNINRKYLNLEKMITSPVFYKTNGNFSLGTKVRNGNIYFCDDEIVCVSLDQKPYTVESIIRNDILYFYYDDIHVHITTKEDRLYCITLLDVAQVLEILKEHDWIGDG